MQLLLKISACAMVQPCTHLVLWGTSQNEIETTGVELERPVVQCSQHSTLRQLECWDHNLCRESTTTVTLPTYASQFLTTFDDYMCLPHEATPNNYVLMRKAYTVQMHIPSIVSLESASPRIVSCMWALCFCALSLYTVSCAFPEGAFHHCYILAEVALWVLRLVQTTKYTSFSAEQKLNVLIYSVTLLTLFPAVSSLAFLEVKSHMHI